MHVLLSIIVFALTGATGPQPLDADHLYYGVGRPVMVTAGKPEAVEAIALVLLAADGEPVAPPVDVASGRVDVGVVLPQIWGIRQACYLQCLHDGQPAGAALVVQPLLSRVVPRTEQVDRPGGTTSTRITGWGPETDTADELEGDDGGTAALDPRVFSGLRIYPERDIVLRTTLGDIVLAMRPDEAPNTAWNFRRLVEGGFYNDVIFHRVIPMTRTGQPFVIQAGDPTAEGDGGPGYWLPLEPSRLPHNFGVISMARADDPDSAGSQFFICLSRAGTARLDGQYAAFGYAVAGAEVIRAIAAVELDDVSTGRPIVAPVIRHAELIASPPRQAGIGRPDSPVVDPTMPVKRSTDRVPR
jgi:peptidyl-prolyl cis-trans isomerase B (cyclophilin B)